MYLLELLFVCVTCEASQVVICCDLMPAFMFLCPVAPWKGLPCMSRSATAFDNLGLPERSYKAIYMFSFPVLNLEASGRD